ncbi:MAG TPA: hypothetical protein VF690_01590 [Hymenobacter sp.]|jgi:hypothetical protein
MKYLLPRLAVLALLAGCSSTNDPTPNVGPTSPAPDDVITLAVTGENLTGLGAELRVTGAAGEDGKPAYPVPALATDETYPVSVNKTIAVATVPHYRAGTGVKRYDFTATIAFTALQPGNTVPNSSGRLRVQWFVNGKASTATTRVPVAELYAANSNGASPYPAASAYLATNSL